MKSSVGDVTECSMSWASWSGHGPIAGKKKTICGGRAMVFKGASGTWGSPDAATISRRSAGEKCFGLIVAIDAGDLKFPANS